jgi:hypothetical protein
VILFLINYVWAPKLQEKLHHYHMIMASSCSGNPAVCQAHTYLTQVCTHACDPPVVVISSSSKRQDPCPHLCRSHPCQVDPSPSTISTRTCALFLEKASTSLNYVVALFFFSWYTTLGGTCEKGVMALISCFDYLNTKPDGCTR